MPKMGVCPYCGQGANTACFAEYHDGYKCFSCGAFKKNNWGLFHGGRSRDCVQGNIEIPKVNKNPSSFTLQAQKWLLDRYITTDMAKYYNIWETERNSFIFPIMGQFIVYPVVEKIGFYVERYYNEKKIFNKGERVQPVLGIRESRTLVIVEDFISAIRIHDAGYNSMCLFGTKSKYSTLYPIITKYDNIVVYLDNDDAGQIKSNVLQLCQWVKNNYERKRSLVYSPINVYNLRTEKDPKWYSRNELQRDIDEIINRH